MSEKEWQIIAEALFLREAMLLNMGKPRDALMTEKIRARALSEANTARYFEEEEEEETTARSEESDAT